MNNVDTDTDSDDDGDDHDGVCIYTVSSLLSKSFVMQACLQLSHRHRKIAKNRNIIFSAVIVLCSGIPDMHTYTRRHDTLIIWGIYFFYYFYSVFLFSWTLNHLIWFEFDQDKEILSKFYDVETYLFSSLSQSE